MDISLGPHDGGELTLELVPGFDRGPVDSSETTPSDWIALAHAINQVMDKFHGFLVVQGTDTLAWTASALGFLLGNVEVPVVVTGSMRPLGNVRTDARTNVIDAVTIAAATWRQPEVAVAFGGRVLRGTRTTKVSTVELRAFDSPCFPALATVGSRIAFAETPTLARRSIEVGNVGGVSVFTVGVHPGLDPRGLPNPEMVDFSRAGVILETFGTGTAPESSLGPWLKDVVKAGAPVVVRSRVLRSTVDLGIYGASHWLRDLGAISGHDITSEACFVKMLLAIAATGSRADQTSILENSVAGESSTVSWVR